MPISRFLIIAISGACLPCWAGVPDGPPPVAIQAGYTRAVFADDFESISLDHPENGRNTWYNELWYGAPRPADEVRASDGILSINVPAESRFHSITTVPRQPTGGISFRHGYFEARMLFSDDVQDWSAFWLLSRPHSAGSDDGRWCEIDIFEHFGPDVFVGTVHDWTKTKRTRNGNSFHRLRRPIKFSVWHTYSLLWVPGRLTWYLDGEALMSAETPSVCEQQDMFLTLSAQKHHEGPPVQLQVDWVRVYSK
ncbi:glycoside hydrolase family 16 protein [Bradyrhizobium sp. CW10]|uniref:glycoside hydrolase family 16 protein n=1 Tax=Bradyrhizobium sp. CW10 TaxID=2782683 RepID=UPI002111BF18|nr:glycoside hydrolase family 16 protein [Bradyrhizobium sp. CW10]